MEITGDAMDTAHSPCIAITNTSAEARADFSITALTPIHEREAALAAAKPALARLVAVVSSFNTEQAVRVRSILKALYTESSAATWIADMTQLDWPLKRDLLAVLLAFGYAEFNEAYLKSAFELAGLDAGRCCLTETSDPRRRLAQAIDFAKIGPISASRTFAEKAMAMILLGLFVGIPCDLQLAFRRLDKARAELVISVIADCIGQAFDFTDEEHVRECFDLPL